MSLSTPESLKLEDDLFNFSQTSSDHEELLNYNTCDNNHVGILNESSAIKFDIKTNNEIVSTPNNRIISKSGHIKIPMNAFMVWAQINRKIMADKNPTLSNLEISRLLGAAWNKMTPQDRKPFIDKAKDLRTEHLEKYPEFKYQPRRRRRKNNSTNINSNIITKPVNVSDNKKPQGSQDYVKCINGAQLTNLDFKGSSVAQIPINLKPTTPQQLLIPPNYYIPPNMLPVSNCNNNILYLNTENYRMNQEPYNFTPKFKSQPIVPNMPYTPNYVNYNSDSIKSAQESPELPSINSIINSSFDEPTSFNYPDISSSFPQNYFMSNDDFLFL